MGAPTVSVTGGAGREMLKGKLLLLSAESAPPYVRLSWQPRIGAEQLLIGEAIQDLTGRHQRPQIPEISCVIIGGRKHDRTVRPNERAHSLDALTLAVGAL